MSAQTNEFQTVRNILGNQILAGSEWFTQVPKGRYLCRCGFLIRTRMDGLLTKHNDCDRSEQAPDPQRRVR